MMNKKIASIFKNDKVVPFLLTIMFFGIVSGMYAGILNNYLHEVLAIGKTQRGIIEIPRELPGLMIFLVVALFYRFSELNLVRISLLMTLVALIGFTFHGDIFTVGITMLVMWSLGEHLISTSRKAIVIRYAKEEKKGAALGLLRGFLNGGQAAGYYLGPLIILVTTFLGIKIPFQRYRIIYAIGAVLIAAALFMTFKLKESGKSERRSRLCFKKKFRKYYLLEIFFGARKQVFMTFAPFVLIILYRADAAYISILYGIWSVVNMFLAPLIGKMVDYVGYKKVLIWDSLGLIVLCFLYGFSGRLFSFNTAMLVTSVVFVIDSISFAMGMARDVYAGTKSESNEEFTVTLSTGLSMNHIVSIVIAAAGGFLWEYMGVEYLFSAAALVGVGSWIIALTLEDPEHTGRSRKREKMSGTSDEPALSSAH